MIALILAAAVVPAFAPPSAAFTYLIHDLFAARPHEAVTTHQRLTFTRDDRGIVAHLTTIARTSEAPPPAQDAVTRLFGPLTGVESKLRLGADGAPGELIDSDRPWAAFLASRAALRAKIDSDPSVSPQTRAFADRMLDAETDPAARDQSLTYPFLQLLPPHLPALAVGASSDFAATIATPTGPLPATGKVTLIQTGDALLRYRITIATAPIAPRMAIYTETNTLSIDRPTGLLIAAHIERSLVPAGAPDVPILIEDISREP